MSLTSTLAEKEEWHCVSLAGFTEKLKKKKKSHVASWSTIQFTTAAAKPIRETLKVLSLK